eukprot:CAMPEP_0195019140 /NCGR_PEP_ID=MMETSP0326_2-20130528/32108_1 /TAXON_ID=2866 ORGANISM="Crypthecodinium cohnii, Strain Seligo" /NCGR_SAMPLE_ID=MMETSP0326_2 /ASSEMBLY_ACC=CAM_ASM_000348 /LENGTH=72 /DNA_ID=CAMNT_0040037037 /DNA_START=91 /DNA_END=306 /DNA_ORIENTATION=-
MSSDLKNHDGEDVSEVCLPGALPCLKSTLSQVVLHVRHWLWVVSEQLLSIDVCNAISIDVCTSRKVCSTRQS